jgi:hypothetical protein
MSDIVERLREYASDDHERLCQGRCYSCSCGYDDKRDPLLEEAADRIEKLEAALHRISLGSQNSGTAKEDLGREARAALEERK